MVKNETNALLNMLLNSVFFCTAYFVVLYSRISL